MTIWPNYEGGGSIIVNRRVIAWIMNAPVNLMKKIFSL